MFFFFFDQDHKQQIIDMRQKLLDNGQLLPEEQIKQEYILFRKHFGPDVLHGLNGEELIETMFNVMNRDGLNYWLEFKKDELFNTLLYGGIAGGNALKYIIYKRKENQKWITGTGTKQEELSLSEAIKKGSEIRDAILRGVDLIDKLNNPNETDYVRLQEQLDKEPEYKVGQYGWIHKYYHMLYPDLIDTYHSTQFQQHALLCSGVKPYPQKGLLYPLTGQVMKIIHELSIPTCHATYAMGSLYGLPISYYRIGTANNSGTSYWQEMYHGSYVSIGWPALGNLREYEAETENRIEIKEKIRTAYKEHYPNSDSVMTRKSGEILRFYKDIKEGDIIVAGDGETVLGVGRIIGDYDFIEGSDFPHTRKVEWLYTGTDKLPNPKEGLRTAVIPYQDFENMLKIRELAASGKTAHIDKPVKQPVSTEKPLPSLDDETKRIESILERKKQVILYGPPGTGKTYYAEKVARELAARKRYRKSFVSLNENERNTIVGDGRANGLIRMCCFHPSYGYEDFIEGIKPRTENGATLFESKDGIFKKLCADANQSDYDFYLIIDEINRGDISRIFGELIMLIEKNKRGKSLALPVSGETFNVPPNVYLIGTMNTADRSIALLDVALRRRFGFKEFLPEYALLEGVNFGSVPLSEWLRQLNQRICRTLGRDARNLQIGHSYFMEGGKAIASKELFKKILSEDVLPLIEEYCYGDYDKMSDILGTHLVDRANQMLQYQLFEGDFAELENALLQPCLNIQKLKLEETSFADPDDESDEEAEG